MKKYYALVQTKIGNVVLITYGKNVENAKNKLYKEYKANKIIQISENPISLRDPMSHYKSIFNTGFVSKVKNKRLIERY